MPRPLVTAAVLAVVLSSCNDAAGPTLPGEPAATSPATVSAAAGAYALGRFNGAALPYTTYDRPQYRVEVVGGALTVAAEGTYQLQIDRRLTDGAGTRTYPNTDSGTVSRRGDTLTFVPASTLPPFAGVLAGPALTVTGSIGARTGTSDQLTFTR